MKGGRIHVLRPPDVGVDQDEGAVGTPFDVCCHGLHGLAGNFAEHVAPKDYHGVAGVRLKCGQKAPVAAQGHAAAGVAHHRGRGREMVERTIVVPVVGEETALSIAVYVVEDERVAVKIEHLHRLGTVLHHIGVEVETYQAVHLCSGGNHTCVLHLAAAFLVKRHYPLRVEEFNLFYAKRCLGHHGAARKHQPAEDYQHQGGQTFHAAIVRKKEGALFQFQTVTEGLTHPLGHLIVAVGVGVEGYGVQALNIHLAVLHAVGLN